MSLASLTCLVREDQSAKGHLFRARDNTPRAEATGALRHRGWVGVRLSRGVPEVTARQEQSVRSRTRLGEGPGRIRVGGSAASPPPPASVSFEPRVRARIRSCSGKYSHTTGKRQAGQAPRAGEAGHPMSLPGNWLKYGGTTG